MTVDDVRFKARRELEAVGMSAETAAYLADDRPPDGWSSLVTKDYLRAELGDLRSDFKDALVNQTRWFVGLLLVALLLLAFELASVRGRKVVERELVSAGSVSNDSATPGIVADSPRRPFDERVGRAGLAVVYLGIGLLLACIVLRGLATMRVPWGNMYEFINLTCMSGLVAGAIVLRRPQYRPLWVFLLVPVLVLLTVSGRWLYTNAAPVMPALQSYWLPIHVSVVSLGSGVFLVAGIAFKLGVVPFHMWIPDVYHGAPTAVTLVIGSAPKLAAFAMAMRLLVNGLLDLAVDWQQMLVLLSVLSMAIGNLAAIAQSNLKRMLAYSTIAHMGFMLLGLLSGVVGGNWLNAADAYASAMFYVLVYVLMSLAAFGMLLYLSSKGFECENLEDVKGLNRRSPWHAFLMLLAMFSLAGVPPMAGFYAKLSVISAVVSAGQIGLAVFAVAMSLIGAFYYLRVVKLMYFDEPKDPSPVVGQSDMQVLLSANGLALLAIGLMPQPLMALCFVAIKSL